MLGIAFIKYNTSFSECFEVWSVDVILTIDWELVTKIIHNDI